MSSQTANKYGAWPIDPDNAPILWLPIAGSQTLARGDFVILSSGLIQIALATSTELVGVVARDCASLTASTKVPVYAFPDTVFEVIANADSSSLVAGNTRDIVGATGAMMMNISGTTYNVLLALRGNAEDTLSSAYARWLVKINKHAFADTST